MLRKQKINESEIMKFGFLGGIAESAYCLLVVAMMMVLSQVMPQPTVPFSGFLLFLLLFVFSVGVSGILVFGYPIYLVSQKKIVEALMTALTTLVTIAIVGILSFILVSFI
ncbi:MAG: hypothetical protein WCW26_00635 [Candidatus Buchananbacteria bacterium]